MDPLVGLVGTVVIASWALSLLRAAGCVLLDTVPDPEPGAAHPQRMEIGGDRLVRFACVAVGSGPCAVIASVVSERRRPRRSTRSGSIGLAGLSHVTVEVHACPH